MKRVYLIGILLAFGASIIVLTFSIKTKGFNYPNVAVLISILTAIFAAGIPLLVLILYELRERKNEEGQLPPRMAPAKEEVLRLEQQESELEKQRSELEKKQQTLIWQMEAATLAKEDPRLAIVTAFQGLEVELQRVVNRLYPTDIPEGIDDRIMYTL